jgi:hypothetical protein
MCCIEGGFRSQGSEVAGVQELQEFRSKKLQAQKRMIGEFAALNRMRWVLEIRVAALHWATSELLNPEVFLDNLLRPKFAEPRKDHFSARPAVLLLSRRDRPMVARHEVPGKVSLECTVP